MGGLKGFSDLKSLFGGGGGSEVKSLLSGGKGGKDTKTKTKSSEGEKDEKTKRKKEVETETRYENTGCWRIKGKSYQDEERKRGNEPFW